MAVLDLKSNILEYNVATPGYEDFNGDYFEGSDRWEGCIPCDLVAANDRADEVIFNDGVDYKYSYVIHMSNSVKDFSIGDKVRVTSIDGYIQEFKVKGFRRYQLQSKLWV